MSGALTPHPIPVDGPLWPAAVRLKRERAYRQLERDGFARAFVEEHYDAFARAHGGRTLHDHKLREEASRSDVVGWVAADGPAERLVAYAVMNWANLLGSPKAPVLNVTDLCLAGEVTPAQCRAVLAELAALAAERSAAAFEVTSVNQDAKAFWEACEECRGTCVSRTYRFILSGEW